MENQELTLQKYAITIAAHTSHSILNVIDKLMLATKLARERQNNAQHQMLAQLQVGRQIRRSRVALMFRVLSYLYLAPIRKTTEHRCV